MMAHQQQQDQPTVRDDDSNIMMDTASLLLSPTSPSTSKKKYKYNTNTNTNTNTSSINDEDHDENPWLYKNQRLNNLDFPIGGFGAGNIVLQGDGTLQGWNIQNQFAAKEYIPLHTLPSNYWMISASYDANDTDTDTDTTMDDNSIQATTTPNQSPSPPHRRPSYLLRSTRRHFNDEQSNDNNKTSAAAATAAAQIPPEIPSIQIEAKYPIATITYNLPKELPASSLSSSSSSSKATTNANPIFPDLTIQMEAMSPLVPTSTKVSSLPLAVFSFSITNNSTTSSVSFDLLQSALNFIGWDGDTTINNNSHDTNPNTDNSKTFWKQNVNTPFDIDTTTDPTTTSSRTCTGITMTTQQEFEQEQITRQGSIALSAIIDKNNNSNDHDDTKSKKEMKRSIQLIKGGVSDEDIFEKFALRDYDSNNTTTNNNDHHDKNRNNNRQFQPTSPSLERQTYIGAVIHSVTNLLPEQTVQCMFVLSWYFPNRPCTAPRDNLPPTIWGNQYTQWFTDAKDVTLQFVHDQWFATTSTTDNTNTNTASNSASNSTTMKSNNNNNDSNNNNNNNNNSTIISPKTVVVTKSSENDVITIGGISLLELTRSYVKTLYDESTIPYEILECAASKLAIMRSPTMFWSSDGIVLGNEGNECCPLNCTHVYGYTTLLERLFPDLAQNMRISDFVINFHDGEGCTMRFGTGGYALDGSLSCVIKVYLVVLQSDPTLVFLQRVWPNVKKQMALLWTKPYIEDGRNRHSSSDIGDGGGVIRIPQQNTYDSAMTGVNTFIGSYLIVALKATAVMATWMGDINFAKKCSRQVEISTKSYEEICWNPQYGYYVADGNNDNETDCNNNSYGNGCFIDQLCATGLSTACGFGYIFNNPDHESMARRSIFRNNQITEQPIPSSSSSSSRHHYHTNHFYPGDIGIRVCTYPNGKVGCGSGMPYENVVSSGLEYGLISGMLLDDNITDALSICNMIRHRQSGIHRSPWNEPERGLYYARSMAGWNIFDQACGFAYDSTKASIGFDPNLSLMKLMTIRNKANSSNGSSSNGCITINKENNQSPYPSPSFPFTFSCFCTFHCGFGKFEQTIDNLDDYDKGGGFASGIVKFQVLFGFTELQSINLKTTAHVVVAVLSTYDDAAGKYVHKTLTASIDPTGIVTFDSKIALKEKSALKLALSSPCCRSDMMNTLTINHRCPSMKKCTAATFSSSTSFFYSVYTSIVTKIYVSPINIFQVVCIGLVVHFVLMNPTYKT